MNKGKVNAALGLEGHEPAWLPLLELAEVEVTSQRESHPIDRALTPGDQSGWQAETPGRQIIRLQFERPVAVRQIRVVVEERERPRTQEFVLRVALSPGGPWRECVRQQFNFSPDGAQREQEDYQLNLASVMGLELAIKPDISGGDSRASLQQLRVA